MKKMRWPALLAAVVLLTGATHADLQEGLQAQQSGDYEKALAVFTRAIKRDPKDAQAYFYRGVVLSGASQFDEAAKDYSKSIELKPDHADAFWSRGYSYANAKKYDLAIADYTRALELGAKEALVRGLRATVYYRMKMYAEADADLNKVLEMDPKDAKAKEGLQLVKKAKADPDFEPDSLNTLPGNLQPAYGGSVDKEERKAHDQFISTVIQAYGTKEKACEETLKRAWGHYQQQDYATAMKRFNQAWLLDQDKPEVHYGFSQVLKVWGYGKDAAAWEKKATAVGYKHNL